MLLDKLEFYTKEIVHSEKMQVGEAYSDKELIEIISNPAKLEEAKKDKKFKKIFERLEEGGMI